MRTTVFDAGSNRPIGRIIVHLIVLFVPVLAVAIAAGALALSG
jgi:hypothetical protein